MARDEATVEAVLTELADLGRRMGQRAGELAKLIEGRLERPTKAGHATRAARRPEPGRSLAPTAPRSTGRERGHEMPFPAGLPSTRPTTVRRAARPDRKVFRWRWAAGPMAMSTLLHTALIMILALTFIVEKRREPVSITLAMDSEAPTDDFSQVAIVATDPPSEEVFEDLSDVHAEMPAAVEDIASVALPEFEAAIPAAPSLAADELLASVPIGLPDTARSRGDGHGQGPGRGQGGAGDRSGSGMTGGAGTFFGRAGQGRSVCFLCDNSNSHANGGFHVVLEEVAKAVEALPTDQTFYVIFFSDAAYPLFHPEPAAGMVQATADNKRRLRSWLGTVEMCRGGQGIHEAVRLAGVLDSDAVYLLSDGQFSSGTVDRVVAADFGQAIVHTFGIQQAAVDRRTGQVDPATFLDQQAWNHNLVTIATSHGGAFSPVKIPPAAAVLERMRPIPRNRVRGAVWGMRL